MRTIITTLKSVSPYQQSRHYTTEKLSSKESARDYEARTWRDRMHVDGNGMVFIPPMAFKNCLASAAKFISEQIPGKGKSTYTKHFLSGVLVTDPLPLGVHRDDVEGEWLFVPSDGIKGSGKRVDKCFPVIREWGGDVTWYVLDETITADVFERTLVEAGKFIGLGAFRPQNGGYYGRFSVVKMTEA